MNIDYFSPLPPVPSGISDYSVDLLPHLMELARVRVVRLPGQPVAPEIVERFQPVTFDVLPESPATSPVSPDGPVPLYQMGNNWRHKPVLARAWSHPGVLVLHDVVLHHLLLDVSLGPDGIGGDAGLAFYVERLTRDHGWMGTPVARTKFWGGYGDAPTFAFPAHRTLLRRQRGVLVHSAWAAEMVREESAGDGEELRIRAVPMGVPLPPPADPDRGRSFRRRHGIPETSPVIGAFGFQTPIKRTLSALAALTDPRLAGAQLLIVGEVSEALDLEAEAREAGVAERIHVTGYVEPEDFTRALAAADVTVNLRYPTAGETSASLLRILAAGRPAVVSDYAQFAELPDGLVAKVPLGDGEREALVEVLSGLLADPARLAGMGEAAREHVRRHHDPARAAAAVVDACREWAQEEPPGDAPPPVPPPTSLAWSRFPGRIEILDRDGGMAGWPPGERRRLTVRLVNDGPATWLAGRSGSGGVALEVRLETEGGDLGAVDLHEDRPWHPLPREVAAGEAVELEIAVRRPPGPARLVIEPHVLGGFGFSSLGGPVGRWEWA